MLAPAQARVAGESHFGDVLLVDVVVDPGAFRTLDEEVRKLGGGRGTVEVLSLAADAGDADAGGPGGAGGADGARARARVAGGAGSADSGGSDNSDADSDGAGRAARAGSGVAASAGPGTAGAGAAAPGAARAATAGGAGVDATAASARGTGMSVRRVAQPGRRLACATCGGLTFETSEAHRDHARCEWHHFNLKRKMRELPPVAEDEFAAIPAKVKQAFLENYD
jgi:hypothetical protein